MNKKTIDKQYNKLIIFQNYKQYLFNESVDNKHSKGKYNGVNICFNFNNDKYKILIQIGEKIRETLEIKKIKKLMMI